MAKAKYTDWLKEDNLIKLEAWARDGLTDEQIANNIGISVRNLYRWKNKHSQICQSLKRGKEVADIIVENALYKSAIGYEYEETKTFIEEGSNGTKKKKIEKTKKHAAPNPTSAIFWLKNRKPDAWRDRKETNVTGSMNIQPKNPLAEFSDEELRRLANEQEID